MYRTVYIKATDILHSVQYIVQYSVQYSVQYCTADIGPSGGTTATLPCLDLLLEIPALSTTHCSELNLDQCSAVRGYVYQCSAM